MPGEKRHADAAAGRVLAGFRSERTQVAEVLTHVSSYHPSY